MAMAEAHIQNLDKEVRMLDDTARAPSDTLDFARAEALQRKGARRERSG